MFLCSSSCPLNFLEQRLRPWAGQTPERVGAYQFAPSRDNRVVFSGGSLPTPCQMFLGNSEHVLPRERGLRNEFWNSITDWSESQFSHMAEISQYCFEKKKNTQDTRILLCQLAMFELTERPNDVWIRGTDMEPGKFSFCFVPISSLVCHCESHTRDTLSFTIQPLDGRVTKRLRTKGA